MSSSEQIPWIPQPRDEFEGCVRYLSLPPSQAPDPHYCKVEEPRTPNVISCTIQPRSTWFPNARSSFHGFAPRHLREVYERADREEPWGLG